MHPTKFKQAYEKPLGAGDNPNTGDLPYVVARDPNTPGPVMLVSCWKLSPEELARVIETGEVYVAVMAHPEYRTQPPISLHGFNPFEYPAPNAYKVAPRTFEEEQVDTIIQGATAQVKQEDQADRSGLLEASGLFPESKGTTQAKEVRLDPRLNDFDIEKTDKDFKVVKPRTFSEEAVGRTIGKHEEEG